MTSPSTLEYEPDGGETFRPHIVAVLGKLCASVDKLSMQLAQQEERDRRKLTDFPARTAVYGFGLYNSAAPNPVINTPTAPLLLDLGAPQKGRVWIVRGFKLADGGNPTATVAGTATWFVGNVVPPQGTLTGWVPVPSPFYEWTFPNLPNATTFTSDSIVVTPAQHILCVVTGGTAGQNIMAKATINDQDVLHEVFAESP